MNCVTSLAFSFLFLFNNKNGLIFLDGMERKEDGVSKIEFHVSGALNDYLFKMWMCDDGVFMNSKQVS